MTNHPPIQLFVFDHERTGATFYARGMMQLQPALKKEHARKMTDPKRGRYLMLISMPGSMQDAHAPDEATALTAIRFIFEKNPVPPINIYLHAGPGLIEKIRSLYTPNVIEQPPPG